MTIKKIYTIDDITDEHLIDFVAGEVSDQDLYNFIKNSATLKSRLDSYKKTHNLVTQLEPYLQEDVGLDNYSHITEATKSERKNIAAASNGCATYMTRNYKRVKNWIYTVMAYNTGVGGAERYIKSKYQGASKMEITSSTHWYVIKFLAHIIAYQDYVGKEAHEKKLLAIPAKSGQSVKSISKKYHLTQEVVKLFLTLPLELLCFQPKQQLHFHHF